MTRPDTDGVGEEFARMFATAGLPQVEAATARTRGRGPFKRLVLRGASIIDGTGAPPWGPADVVVENGRITVLKKVGTPKLPINPDRRPAAGDFEIDCTGKFLTPGLVDAHAHIGAPFHAVCTAEQAQAYKPRFQAFEYMIDQLGCSPEHILHVSSSLRYDLMTAHDMRFGARAFVNRGHGPGNAAYGYHEIQDIGGLPGLLGL